MNMIDINILNDVIIEGRNHFYRINLSTKTYNLDNVTPVRLKILDRTIEEGTWTRLIIRLTNFLINHYSLEKKTLLKIYPSWSKSPMFTETQVLQAYHKLDNDIFINCNRTSTHLCWYIYELIRLLNINPDSCELIIFKYPSIEKEDIRIYYNKKNQMSFVNFLSESLNYDKEQVAVILDSITKMDSILKEIAPNWVSLFNIDDSLKFANIKSRFKQYLQQSKMDIKFKTIIIKILNIFTDYHAFQDKKSFLNNI